MPIANIQDAQEVERSLQSILAAPDINTRIQTVRTLFVEILDYYPADQRVSLGPASNDQLPDDAYIVARRDGVSAVYVPLDDTTTNRITGTAASAAAKVIGNALADEPLLLFTNRDGDQLHIIRPDLVGSRPRLQRIVAHRGQHQRTVVQQIANMWDDYGNRGKTISDAIANAFSVEPVTKEFFETHREIFEDAKASISGFGGDKADQGDKHLFTQTLFNRLMFIYFLSKKGWLKFNGDTDYLNALWHDHQLLSSHGNFYTTRLRSLFFSGLNDPNRMDSTQEPTTLIGEVPFLNGGLFEETDLDRTEGITVPDETIEQVLIGLFDKFNFTITESTPFDVEVAVDPEMLGKVFEELVTGRHGSGAYYTPRPVVSFMCREALKGYLEGQDTGLAPEAVARFVDGQDTDGIQVAQARRIAEALAEVTVVDPACGSGAYLLGMMQELIGLQTALYNAGADAKALYDLKLEIIQRNLYGVDIDSFAVNIAMLRMWLSLAIDYDGSTPEPLPNLDFKVVCGDSLLGPDPSVGVEMQGTLGRDADRIKQLGQLKAEYLRASLGSEKERLKGEIGKLREEIGQAFSNAGASDGIMDWRVEFAEVFATRRGFDIAIANPPYVQLQSNGGELANLYKDGGYSTFTRAGDLYYLFYERGINLLKDAGQLCYISSNQWMRVKSGKVLRQFLEKQNPMWLINLGADVFDSVTVNTCVILANRSANRNALQAADVRQATQQFPPSEWTHIYPANGEIWTVLSADEDRIKAKMERVGMPLKDWDISIKYGIKTGYDKGFIVDNATKEEMANLDSNSAHIFKPLLRGRDIKRYQTQWPGSWLLNIPWHFPLHLDSSIKGVSELAESLFQEQYLGIYDYLLSHKSALSARNKAETGVRYEWYALQRWAAKYHLEFAKDKIVWGNMNSQAAFAYAPAGMFISAPATMLTPYSPYMLALLNSTLVDWYFRSIGVERDGGFYEYKPMFIERLPIPTISAAEQEPFIELVDELLAAKAADLNADTNELERNIDRLVYDLYGLTEEEDTAVERSLGLIHASDEEEDQAILRAMLEGEADPENVAGEISRAEFEEIMMTWREEELAG